MFENLKVGDKVVLQESRLEYPLSIVTVERVTPKYIWLQDEQIRYLKETGKPTGKWRGFQIFPLNDETKELLAEQKHREETGRKRDKLAWHLKYSVNFYGYNLEDLIKISKILGYDPSRYLS